MEELQNAIFKNLFQRNESVWDRLSRQGNLDGFSLAFDFSELREAKTYPYVNVCISSLQNIKNKLTEEEMSVTFVLCGMVASNDFNFLFSSKHKKIHTTETLMEALGMNETKFNQVTSSLIKHNVLYHIQWPSDGKECYILNPTLCQSRAFFHKSLIAHIKNLAEGEPLDVQTIIPNH